MLVLITGLSGDEASKPDSLFRIFSLLFQCPEVHEKHSSALLCAAGRKRKQCSSSNYVFSRILLRFSGSSASSDHVLPVMNHGYIEPIWTVSQSLINARESRNLLRQYLMSRSALIQKGECLRGTSVSCCTLCRNRYAYVGIYWCARCAERVLEGLII